MTKLLQIGCSSAAELHDDFGHIACTLGGINYESRGSRGCIRGSSARGATNRIFRHHFYLVLSDDQAQAARTYADSCVGQEYDLGAVPSAHHGGDCSGYLSGIICVAKGRPTRRLFTTATWPHRFDDADLRFRPGLGGGLVKDHDPARIGVLDRPFPGRVFSLSREPSNHVRWIQARLNFAARQHLLVVDGEFGRRTRDGVIFFQKEHDLEIDGEVGRQTWHRLLAVR